MFLCCCVVHPGLNSGFTFCVNHSHEGRSELHVFFVNSGEDNNLVWCKVEVLFDL